MSSAEKIESILKKINRNNETALVPFFTAGYPQLDSFASDLINISKVGDVVEIGVPFSDPMADGMTIQRSSHQALINGVSLKWIFDQIEAVSDQLQAPLVMMSYLNPLLAFGYEELAQRAKKVGIGGFIVPDLPLEESYELQSSLENMGLGLIQLITPATPIDRMVDLCAASKGFVYAVTMTGITGSDSGLATNLAKYLDQICGITDLPVCAGFGVRSAEDVKMIGRHAAGAIVGSALVEVMEREEDFVGFLERLR
ncbi:MAG: tryptophan synthase subunit alpha [Woeseiaceae bacterium]|jgi:tryptophan synthase alpha chain|nr:tryptophan synthase subunit alpha [Woeseiaceae bacterium]